MAKTHSRPQPAGISLGDIVYVLFKHKWKIMLTTLLACAAAGAYYFRTGPVYESQAKLMVRYIVEESAVDGLEDKISTTTGGRVTDSVIKSEMEILTSWDVALEAAYVVTGTLREDRQNGAAAPQTANAGGAAAASGGKGANEKSEASNTGGAQAQPGGSSSQTAASKPGVNQDLVERYADKLRVSRLIPRSEDPVTEEERMAAVARTILRGLTVSAEPGSNVISVTFRHSDPMVPHKVLTVLVDQFLDRHIKLHRSIETAAQIQKMRDEATSKLHDAESKLKDKKAEHNVISLADTMAALNAQKNRIKAELTAANVEYEEQKARLDVIKKMLAAGAGGDSAPKTNNAGNGAPPESGNAGNTPPPPEAGKTETAGTPPGDALTNPPPPVEAQQDPAVVSKYQDLIGKIAGLHSYHVEQMKKFPPGSEMIRGTESQIAELKAERRRMETRYPYLIVNTVAAAGPGSRIDIVNETSLLSAIDSRRIALAKAEEKLNQDIASYAGYAPVIEELQRNFQVAEAHSKYIEVRAEKTQVDGFMTSRNIPNISKLQEATPSVLNISQRAKVIVAMVAGGPVLSITLVLIFGLLLNRNIKRAADLEENVNHPLWLSIPYFSRRNRLKACRPMGAGKTTGLMKNSENEKAPWEQYHFMHPFADALRDRLSSYFDATGNIRKPKLIAVTGYSVGAGVSTLAGGLASSLSEIGDGKVLLVDMNGAHGAAHPFFDGRPALSLTKALRLPPSAPAVVPSLQTPPEEKLYVARADANSAMVSAVGLRRLLPELKASEFDYIVFDMPPLGQTKPTATLAGLMDKVLVIVEAEANSKSDVRRGCRDLEEAGADFSMIFNKSRSHGPRALVGGIS